MTITSESIAAFVTFEELMTGDPRVSDDLKLSAWRLGTILRELKDVSDEDFAVFLRAFRIQMRNLRIKPVYTYDDVKGKKDEIPVLPERQERVLRTKLIRVAHENRDMRPHLLPLLRVGAMGKATATEMVELLTELAKGKFRHSTSDKHALEMLVSTLRRVQTMSESDLRDFVATYRQLTSRKPIRP